jgi:hypothetical protein
VSGWRPSNIRWNPAGDDSPASPRLVAPAPYQRPGLSPWPDRYCSWSVASSRVPDRGRGRRLGHRRRARLGRGAGLAAGRAPPRAGPAAGGPQRPSSHPLPHRPTQPPPAAPQLVHPGLPGALAARAVGGGPGLWALRRALGRQPTRPGAFTTQDIDRYVAAAAQPGALRAAINYYRAAVRPTPWPRPRLASGGRPDPGHLGRPGPLPGSGAGRAGPGLGPGGAGRADPQASHWVQADTPERVNQLMVAFLQPIGG